MKKIQTQKVMDEQFKQPLKKDEDKCLKGHKLTFVDQPINDPDYGDGTDFKCYKCYEPGKFIDGAYRCAQCSYDVHKKCIDDPVYEYYLFLKNCTDAKKHLEEVEKLIIPWKKLKSILNGMHIINRKSLIQKIKRYCENKLH